MSSTPGAMLASPALRPLPARAGRARRALLFDRAHHALLRLLALLVFAAVLLIAWECASGAWPAMRAFGWRFLVSTDWNPVANRFGALPYLYGTAVSSTLALLLAVPLGIGTAIYLAELAPRGVGSVVSFTVELLAAIPSIVYGIWGLFVLAPVLRAAA